MNIFRYISYIASIQIGDSIAMVVLPCFASTKTHDSRSDIHSVNVQNS
jgi:hypothetical protein